MDRFKSDMARVGEIATEWVQVLMALGIVLTPILLVAALIKYIFFG